MLTKWETGTKIDVAQRLLNDLVDSLSDVKHVEMALRVYGHQKPVPPQDCNDTKLEVPFSANNASKIKQKLRSIKPKGTTPIAHSLELSATDFPTCSDCRNIVILITDGIEACDGDPCAVSLALQKKGIILKPFVIGIGLENDFNKTFDCVGRYFNATNEDRFKEVLNVVISQALNSTTAQVNLLDESGRPTETNVNMTFYDEFSGEIKYNFIHTINHRGNPDTLRLDPVPVYRLHVHTLPPVEKGSIEIIPGKHTIIAVDAPQGDLMVKLQDTPNNSKDLQFIVRQKDSSKTLNVQTVNQTEKYIIGVYSLELLTIPRLLLDDVQVSQSKTTTVQIPKPGLITFTSSAPGYGALYQMKGKDLVWIYNLNSNTVSQTIAMQPGTYKVISRAKNAKESAFTTQQIFTVTSGGAEKIVLF